MSATPSGTDPFVIDKVAGGSFRSDAALLKQMSDVIAPSYADGSHISLLDREVKRCDTLYVARLADGTIASFFMVAWETLPFRNHFIPVVYLGLSGTSPATKNSGLVRQLYAAFVADAKHWELKTQQPVVLWGTTASPAVFHAVPLIFGYTEPFDNGTHTNLGSELCNSIREHMHWAHFPTDHPFVIRGVAGATRYSAAERCRLEKICRAKHFTLFSSLEVEEQRGDRLLLVCWSDRLLSRSSPRHD